MVRENRIVVLPHQAYFACVACDDRTFSTKEHLLQHCRAAKIHTGEWCEGCEWLFVSCDALDAHLRGSPNHWICSVCKLDEDGEEDLVVHMADTHSHCYHCDVKVGNYREHRIQHYNQCNRCDEEFNSTNELVMVREARLKL